MKANRKSNADHSIEVVGNELRSKMKFLQTEKLVDKKKN
jgi:ketol-acid reductoisomerase